MRLTTRVWRDQFGDDAPMRCDGDPFVGFYAADIPTQVVLQFPDAGGSRVRTIATCGINEEHRRGGSGGGRSKK
jgi:hypothetical protein